jgi:hypothetical protein
MLCAPAGWMEHLSSYAIVGALAFCRTSEFVPVPAALHREPATDLKHRTPLA